MVPAMPIIGIDLGTTNSLVAVLRGERPEVIANELGERLTPSAVAVAEDGALLVGRAAKDRLVQAPDSGVAFFKRDMGSDVRYRFGGRQWSPVECSAAVLRELRRVAEVRLGEPVAEAVVSVPAYFHDGPRQATIAAAQLAGMTVKRLINEPTAAALAYGFQHRERETQVLVFDLGGGTFDVTLLELFSGVIDVKSSGGDSRLGGEDYNDALLELVATRLKLGSDAAALARLRPLVEVLKRRLSAVDAAELRWQEHSVSVTRADFATSTAGITARIRPVVVRCLRDAGVAVADLDAVLLVGGASRMPLVREILTGLGVKRIEDGLDPDLVVAEGAAVQAALAGQDAAVGDLVLTDVAPHTLGVEVAHARVGGPPEPGFFSPLIDRNTTLPVSRSHLFHTMHPMQDQVELEVYQGEHRLVKHNHLLGKLMVKGLRHEPQQVRPGEIEVRFTYDMNGVLEVDVTVLATGARHTLLIESRPGQLSAKELAEIRARLAPLKIHPRDLLPNRARLERGQRLYAELSGATRAHLEHLLTIFEEALESQDHRRIAQDAAILDQFLGTFFHDEGEWQGGGDRDDGGKSA